MSNKIIKLNNLPLGEISKHLKNKTAAALARTSTIARNATKKNMENRKKYLKKLASAIEKTKPTIEYYMLDLYNEPLNTRIESMLNAINMFEVVSGLTKRQVGVLKLAYLDHSIAVVSQNLTFPWKTRNAVNRLVKDYNIPKAQAEKLIKNLKMPAIETAAKVRSNSQSMEEIKKHIGAKTNILANYMIKL